MAIKIKYSSPSQDNNVCSADTSNGCSDQQTPDQQTPKSLPSTQGEPASVANVSEASAQASTKESPSGSATTASPAEQVSPLVKALQESKPTAPPSPWTPVENYTILDALKDQYNNQPKGKTLLLVPKPHTVQAAASKNSTIWEVLSYDAQTSRAVLKGDGLTIKPVISQREVSLYDPFWK
jgi:hypothetical protein